MSGTWSDKLASGLTVLLDGATGSELRRRGMPMSPETWSGLAALTHPALLERIHADYIEAGADVITTNSFATARFVLEAAGCGEQFAAVNHGNVDAVLRARDRAGPDIAIAGSISCLPPRFDACSYPDTGRERAAYLELAELFAHRGVDLIALEMMQDTRHARLAYEAVSAVGLPVWLGVSCRRDPRSGSLVAFDFPAIALEGVLDALSDHEPAVVNVMHSPPDAVAPALAAIAARRSGPIGAYAELTAPAAATVGPAAFADLAAQWLAAGARVLGGCCGTTPAHIRALAGLRATREP